MESGVARWSRHEALDALAWLMDAGVDTVVSDLPGKWLREPSLSAPETALPEPVVARNPAAQPERTGEPEPKIITEGMAEAGVALMLTADPRAGEGRILGDSEALLLGRMMAAIGLNLDELLRLGLPGGVEPDAAGPPPVSIPSARALLLLGDGPSKALLGKAAGQARGTVHQIELGGRLLSAVATFAPHFLIRQPRMKALAWADLRLFATLIA